jgi:hypothetical protein
MLNCLETHLASIYFCDSQSAIYLTKNQMFHERTKHINVKYHYVREVIADGRLKVPKISIHDNPADMMTKHVLVAKFDLYSSLVGITVLAQVAVWRQQSCFFFDCFRMIRVLLYNPLVSRQNRSWRSCKHSTKIVKIVTS